MRIQEYNNHYREGDDFGKGYLRSRIANSMENMDRALERTRNDPGSNRVNHKGHEVTRRKKMNSIEFSFVYIFVSFVV